MSNRNKKTVYTVAIGILMPIKVLASTTPQSLFSLTDTATETKIMQSSLFLKANFFEFGGKIPQAFKTYHQLISSDVPSEVYGGYLPLLFKTNQFDAIIKLIDAKPNLLGNDPDLKRLYLYTLLQTGKYPKRAAKLQNEFPNDPRANLLSASKHMQKQNPQKALLEIEASTKKNHPAVLLLKAKAHLQLNQLLEALKSVNEAISHAPNFDQAILFKGLLLEKTGNIDRAIATYKSLHNLKQNPHISKHIIGLYITQKKYEQALVELKKLDSNEPEYFFDIALLEWRSRNVKNALTSINKAIAAKPTFTKAKLLKIDMLFAQRNYVQLVADGTSWLTRDPKDNIIINAFSTLTHKGLSTIKVLQLFDTILTKHPTQQNIKLARADLLLQMKRYQDALNTYQTLLNTSNSENLKSHLAYQIGYVHFRMNNTRKAIETLKAATKQTVVQPNTFNLLAYLLAKENVELPIALAYANKALEAEPTSPHFLDTKGFVLLKQNNRNQAIVHFERALKEKPNDSLIKQHLHDAKK